jgi:hypothetical protein
MNLGIYAEVRGRGDTLLDLGCICVPKDIFQHCHIEICRDSGTKRESVPGRGREVFVGSQIGRAGWN